MTFGKPQADRRVLWSRPTIVMIVFENITKSFGPKLVIDDVSVSIMDREIFFVIGQSGVGKSVLIKMLIGLLKPDSGRIFIDEDEVTSLDERGLLKIRKKCGMVFQHSTLFDSLTLVENVALPIQKHRNLSLKKALDEAMRYLEMVYMAEFADRYPASLGDGLKKQVAIARTLTLEPRYVLFDEPTTGLDPISARRVDSLITELSRNLDVTSIVVSHDPKSIFQVADRIMMLYKGKIRHLGDIDSFGSSADPVVRQFASGTPEGPMEI
jgi:phospholipid/cholesterol/gamma-HCH transport system ATP-binding protein